MADINHQVLCQLFDVRNLVNEPPVVEIQCRKYWPTDVPHLSLKISSDAQGQLCDLEFLLYFIYTTKSAECNLARYFSIHFAISGKQNL